MSTGISKVDANGDGSANRGYIQQGIDWLKKRQPETVVAVGFLAVVLYIAVVGVPWAVSTIKEGYKEVQDKSSATIEKMSEAHSSELRQQRTDLLKHNDDQRTDFKEAIKSNTDQLSKSVDRLTDQLQKERN